MLQQAQKQHFQSAICYKKKQKAAMPAKFKINPSINVQSDATEWNLFKKILRIDHVFMIHLTFPDSNLANQELVNPSTKFH